MDRVAYLLEGAAAADIGDGIVDVLVGRLRVVFQKRAHRHDHAALAIAALRHVVVDSCLLHLAEGAFVREALDGRDLLADRIAHGDAAGARRDAVHMNRAGAALCNAAAIFCSREPDILTDGP